MHVTLVEALLAQRKVGDASKAMAAAVFEFRARRRRPT